MSTPARYAHINLTPPKGVVEAAKSFLKAVERGEAGDGLEDVTIREARAVARGEAITWAKADKLMRFWTRNERFLDADKDTPAWTSALGWFARAGFQWANKLRDQKQAADTKDNAEDPAKTPAKPSERRTGSSTNKSGSASGSRGGISIDEATEKALANKVAEHNDKHGETKGKRVDVGMLKAVYRRGAGAFSTSHRPGMTRNQWSMGRVNAFLHLVRTGKPKAATYTTDNDLLPSDHPRKSEAKNNAEGVLEFAESDRRRIQIFTDGPVKHPKGEFVVDDAFFAALKRYLDVQRARGYAPPVMRQHGEDGLTYGRVLDLIRTDKGIDADVEFAKGMAQLYDDGFLDSWSPSFYERFIDPHDGEEYAPAFRELSFVSVRQLKNLPGASPHYLFSEDGGDGVIIITPHDDGVTMSEKSDAPAQNEEHGDEEKSEKSMGERMEAMEKQMGELREYMEGVKPMMERVKSMMEDEDKAKESGEDDDKPVESSESRTQVVALSERVAELERENARLDVRARLGASAPEETVEQLAKLKSMDTGMFESFVAKFSERVAGTTIEIGSGALASRKTSSSKSPVELAEQAKSEGIKRGAPALKFLRRHGITGEAAATAVRSVYG